MHRQLYSMTVAALLCASVSGCSNYLTGPGIDQDPNNPSLGNTSNAAIFSGFQAVQASNFGPTLGMTICGWIQQCKGVNGRFVEQNLSQYNGLDATTFDTQFLQLYISGGLNDLRTLRARLATQGDQVWVGITKIWEAIIASEAADKWGDIPFSEVGKAGVDQPKLDDQLAIYDASLALLDEGITDVNSGTGAGPGGADFAFGGDPASWTAVAHTMKARILLHKTRAVCGATTLTVGGCALYTQIAAEAQLGIQQGGNDLNINLSGSGAPQSNTWYTFYANSGFGPDLRGGDTLVARLKNSGDPRFNTYFVLPSAAGLGAQADADGYLLKVSFPATSSSARPQPWITADENSFILAEALYLTGNSAGALTAVNTVRTKYGATALGAFSADPINDIITEKWVTLLENPEVWNDYKRTCKPDITPTSSQGPVPGFIPRRLFYGQSEQDNNGNIPSPSSQLGDGGTQKDGTPVNLPGMRNKNDPPPPAGCTPRQAP
jgi:hypothetical protein